VALFTADSRLVRADLLRTEVRSQHPHLAQRYVRLHNKRLFTAHELELN